MRRNKVLDKLLSKAFFTAKDARPLGISSSVLAYYVKLGTIERVAAGFIEIRKIENSAPFQWQDLLETAQSVRQGTICLISALAYYGLTLEITREFWIAVPHETKDIKRRLTRIVRMRNFKLGRLPLELGVFKTHIYDKERSVIDAFRFLSRETAIYALKEYLVRTKEHRPDIPKLARYARELRVNIRPYLEVLT